MGKTQIQLSGASDTEMIAHQPFQNSYNLSLYTKLLNTLKITVTSKLAAPITCILLKGSAGNGKTSLVRSLADNIGLNLVEVCLNKTPHRKN
jgi:midasin (ATPase involved in ribosome maturation)